MEAPQIPQPAKTNLELLAKAIRRKSMVSFIYQGGEQFVVEPIVLGVLKETGKHVLRCYKSFPLHLVDKKDNWCLIDLDDISNLKVTPMRCKDYRKGGKTLGGDMSEIIDSATDYVKA